MFSDLAEINIKAGNGGNGRLSFLHEKYREFGGPDGGNGGSGGDIVFRADTNWNTLYYYKTHRKLAAENGEAGKERKKNGRNGEDLIVKVPLGTIIFDIETNEQLADVSVQGQDYVIALGGEGGYGNAHFTSSKRQKPEFAELGIAGEEYNVRLEMKLIADVGLVGLPNIGKSTFLSVVTAAKPKIADYPFTTIIPNLGVVERGDKGGFVIADIPGLIAGASQGKGLGDEFLRHIERTRIIVHFVDSLSEDIEADFKVINAELKTFNPEILKKPQILAVSRIDLLNGKEKVAIQKKAEKIISTHKTLFKYDKQPYLFSAAVHTGLDELNREIELELGNIPKAVEVDDRPVLTIQDARRNVFNVEKNENGYLVTGPKIERFALKTDFTNPHATMRLYDIMRKMGIVKRVEKLGANYGDKIIILETELDFRG